MYSFLCLCKHRFTCQSRHIEVRWNLERLVLSYSIHHWMKLDQQTCLKQPSPVEPLFSGMVPVSLYRCVGWEHLFSIAQAGFSFLCTDDHRPSRDGIWQVLQHTWPVSDCNCVTLVQWVFSGIWHASFSHYFMYLHH